MKTPKGDIKHYLDYLDKEMTIQGILSAFCMAVVGLVLNKVLGAESKNTMLVEIQMRGWAFVVAGSTAIVTAALLFYLQRSYLANTLGKVASTAAQEIAGPEWNICRLPMKLSGACTSADSRH